MKCGQQWSNAYIKSLFDSKGLPDYVDPILKNRYWALNSCKIQQQTAKLRAKARAATEPIQKAYAEEMSTVLCFVAGTAVKAEEGDRAIEEIKVGDRVWSYSPETGETALKQVTRTFVNETDRLVRLIVNGEEILTTPEHPFYVPHSVDERASDWGLGSGWLRAADLRAGDVLYLLDGSSAIVESVEQILLDVPVTVYNFEVEHFHSYFVSPSGLLVHNTCPDENQKIIQKWGKDYKKTGISENDAMALWELAVEYNVPGHAPGYDSYKYGYHMKIYNYHINIIS